MLVRTYMALTALSGMGCAGPSAMVGRGRHHLREDAMVTIVKGIQLHSNKHME